MEWNPKKEPLNDIIIKPLTADLVPLHPNFKSCFGTTRMELYRQMKDRYPIDMTRILQLAKLETPVLWPRCASESAIITPNVSSSPNTLVPLKRKVSSKPSTFLNDFT